MRQKGSPMVIETTGLLLLIKRRVEGVKVLGVEFIRCDAQTFAESIILE